MGEGVRPRPVARICRRLERASSKIDDRTLWTVGTVRADLVTRTRNRLERQLARRGASPDAIDEAKRVLDPDVLTLGFARRFAEYKRPNLLPDRLVRLQVLLNDTSRPLQIVVAGKAHPPISAGRSWWSPGSDSPDSPPSAPDAYFSRATISRRRRAGSGGRRRINTPRRPWEASGTSGMKVLVNGGLNLSVLDGGGEAYAPGLGWRLPAIRRPTQMTAMRVTPKRCSTSSRVK